jgi:hypothetical protein
MTTEDTALAETAATTPPDDEKVQDDLHEVMVDQWGWRAEYTKGQVIHRADLDPQHYDFEHAVRMGTLRPLTVAEARMWTPPPEQAAVKRPVQGTVKKAPASASELVAQAQTATTSEELDAIDERARRRRGAAG